MFRSVVLWVSAAALGSVYSLATVRTRSALSALTRLSATAAEAPAAGKKPRSALSKLMSGQPRKRLRVALLVEPTPFTHISGYANRFKEMLTFMHELGDTVEVATPDDSPEAPSAFAGFNITTISGFKFALYDNLLLSMDSKYQAREMVERFKPDLLHVTSPGFLVMPAVWYAKMKGIPLVLSYHTHLPVYAEKYANFGIGRFSTGKSAAAASWLTIKYWHSFADLTLVTSPQMQKEFKAAGVKRVRVWKKGVDIEVFNPKHRSEETRRNVLRANPEGTGPILMYVGRLSVEKRLDDLEYVMDAIPDANLALIGGGPHEAALRKSLERFGDRVKFVGVLRGDELSSAYASADIFCMPSDSETLGFVVIEAMASGLAVVAADAGGIPSIVKNNSNGLLVPPANPELFANAVRKVLGDTILQERLKHKARSDAEGWGWKAATVDLSENLYKWAIDFHEKTQRKRDKDIKNLKFFKRVRTWLVLKFPLSMLNLHKLRKVASRKLFSKDPSQNSPTTKHVAPPPEAP